MATATGKAQCIICGKERSAVRCEGCLQIFCYNHLADHRQELNKQFDEIEVNRDILRETLNQQTTDLETHPLIKQIDQWEEESIKKIKQTAEECKGLLLQHTTEHLTRLETNLTKLTEELRQIRRENDFNEIDLNQFKDQLAQLAKELEQPSNVSIQQDAASPVNKISIVVCPSEELLEKSHQETDQSHEKQNVDNELLRNEIEVLRMELNERDLDQHAYTALKTSFTEIEKRCVKHQKTEIDLKRQLAVYQNFIKDLQREIEDLTERLSAAGEDYKTLFRKYALLEHSMETETSEKKANTTNKSVSNKKQLVSILRNTYENEQETKPTLTRTSMANIDAEVRQCPMCYWKFPEHMDSDSKHEHIERHFE